MKSKGKQLNILRRIESWMEQNSETLFEAHKAELLTLNPNIVPEQMNIRKNKYMAFL